MLPLLPRRAHGPLGLLYLLRHSVSENIIFVDLEHFPVKYGVKMLGDGRGFGLGESVLRFTTANRTALLLITTDSLGDGYPLWS